MKLLELLWLPPVAAKVTVLVLVALLVAAIVYADVLRARDLDEDDG